MLPEFAVLALLAAAARSPLPRVEVNLIQKYLVAGCLDGTPIKSRQRRWKLAARPHAVSFTMGDDPAKAGYATVRFTPQVGHKYEIEVQAPAMSFPRRAWERGTWKPVVHDRTANVIVTGEPEWSATACPAEAASPGAK